MQLILITLITILFTNHKSMRVYEYVKRLNNEIDWLYYLNFVVRFSAIKKEVSISAYSVHNLFCLQFSINTDR